MKNILLLTVVIFSIASCKTQTTQEINLLDVKQFEEQITKKSVQLIDVRTPDEFQEGHLNDALNIDYKSNNFESEITKLDKTQPVYLYCRSGGRSGSASQVLKELGFTQIYDLDGGILAWKSAQKPIVQ